MFSLRKFFVPALMTGFLFQSCYGVFEVSSKDFTLAVKSSFNFSKNNTTFEDLDKGDYKKTAPTTSWRSNRKYETFILSPRVIWKLPDTKYFMQFSGSYGWLLDGRSVGYPLRWDADGHVYGFSIKAGYIYKVCDRFDFIPYAGYRWGAARNQIDNQHEAKKTSFCFINRNGTKAHTYLNTVYGGAELAFVTNLFDCYKIQISTAYELGYGWGNGHTHTPRFFLTNTPDTSLYGSHTKYRDLISHAFSVAAAHSFAKKWLVAIELDYGTTYNTHNLPVKLKHNDRIVKAGLFKKSQYHVLSDDVTQTFSIVFGLAYSFGEVGDWINR